MKVDLVLSLFERSICCKNVVFGMREGSKLKLERIAIFPRISENVVQLYRGFSRLNICSENMF